MILSNTNFNVLYVDPSAASAGDGSTRTHSWQGETDRRFCALVPRGRVTLVFGGDYDYTVTRMALCAISPPRETCTALRPGLDSCKDAY
mgnify:CR=1 FL=1